MVFAGTSTQINNIHSSHIPKSITISELIGAGKLIKPVEHNTVSLALESFDFVNKVWHKMKQKILKLEKKALELGVFDIHLEPQGKENCR